ncbi:MAG: hypothetical protein ACRDRK_14700 [Pseudonocardia sp.]
MAADPQDSVPRSVGDGARYDSLCSELRLLRVEGLGKAREIHIPCLEDAASKLGHLDDNRPLRDGVEALLRAAVGRMGESREATAVRHTFGLVPGAILRNATDRRRAAAHAQSVGIDRFRKHYEPLLITAVAEEISALLTFAAAEETAAGSPREMPVHTVFAGEQQVSVVMAQARATADWDLVEGVYRQCVDIAEDPHGTSMPRDVAGFLAETFGRISANYYGREDELVLHALGILGNIDRFETISAALFQRLYLDRRFDRFSRYSAGGAPLRRPRPFESLVETARRFRDLNTVQRGLAGVPSTGILGGSLNYGRFFTVRGPWEQDTPSDVDVMVVLPDFGHLDAAAVGLRTVAVASSDDVRALADRARAFATQELDDGRTVFSHPVRMWAHHDDPLMAWAPNPGEYRLHLTFASLAVLDWILVADTAKLNGDSAGHSRSVREYSPHDTGAEDHQRSFSGRNLRLRREIQPVAGGVLRASRVYTIDADSGRYYPGVLQNLVLPRFSQRWGSGSVVPIRGRFEAFRWKIIERLRYERRLRPYEMLRMSLAHTRWEMFAPHVLRAVDSGDNTA